MSGGRRRADAHYVENTIRLDSSSRRTSQILMTAWKYFWQHDPHLYIWCYETWVGKFLCLLSGMEFSRILFMRLLAIKQMENDWQFLLSVEEVWLKFPKKLRFGQFSTKCSKKRKWEQFERKDDIMMIWDSLNTIFSRKRGWMESNGCCHAC